MLVRLAQTRSLCSSRQAFPRSVQSHSFRRYALLHPHPSVSSLSLLLQGEPILKKLPAARETQARPLGREDPPEKGVATHSSVLAWSISGTREPGGLLSMGSHRVGHD